MRIAELAKKRVAIWGFGREGRAVISAIRAELPQQPLTLYCRAQEAAAAFAFDSTLTLHTHAPGVAALTAYDVVVKSPGISAYKPEIIAAQEQGTHFTSGTALWFAQNADARVIAITGTKGKSTTAAFIAHLARGLGVRTALAGNIGLPLLDLHQQYADLWVIELSSFQTGEAGPVELGVVTSLYREHLDWHGSYEHYVIDKLKLAERSRTLLINGLQPELLRPTATHPQRRLFGVPAAWNVHKAAIYHATQRIYALSALRTPGLHNALNASAALAALDILGWNAVDAAPALRTFHPLPHRLQYLGRRNGVDWINDSISTTFEATLAALDSLPGRDVTVILGGYDRGLDWAPFAQAMQNRSKLRLITQGANGRHIASALRQAETRLPLWESQHTGAAVNIARHITPVGGVVLLSPGAPSFDQFTDYAQRGQHFAELAGFDAQRLADIEGIGVH